jgi:hypothetical protein
MADKTHVEVEKFTADGDVDSKFKSKAIASMTKAAEAAIEASGSLTLDAPKQKGAKGWSLIGNLVSLGPDKAGKTFQAVISFGVSTWPVRSMKSFPTTKGGFPIASADEKISLGDVDQVVTRTVKDAMKTIVGYMENATP